MGAWGKSSADDTTTTAIFTSASNDLLTRFEQNDPSLTSITILPMKSFTDTELNRISTIFETSSSSRKIHLQSLHCSGHAVSPEALHRFGKAITILCNNNKSNLTSLAIGDVNMGDDGIQAFVDGMLSTPLTTAGSLLQGDNEGEEGGFSVAYVNCSLTALDFSYKGMTTIGMMSIAKLCHACPNITHLNLSRNTFTYAKGIEIPHDVDIIFQNVIELDLSSCEIDTKFTRRIFQLLDYNDGGDDHSCNKSIGNDGSGRRSKTKDQTAMKRSSSPAKQSTIFSKNKVAMAIPLGTSTSTRTIRLDHNPIGDKGFKQLIKLNRLEGLHVSNCQLTDAAMLYLTVTATYQLNDCTTLDISNNKMITKTGMTVLGDALKRRFISVLLPKLTNLNISGNESIGSDGIQSLLMGFTGRTFESCDFSETNCGSQGAILAIVGSLKEYCCTIQSLRLYNNRIGSNGFYKISEILADILLASEVHTLDLAGNNAGQVSVVAVLNAVLNAIERSVSKNRKAKISLKCLIIGGNQGGYDVEAVVKQIHILRPDIDIARDKKVKA